MNDIAHALLDGYWSPDDPEGANIVNSAVYEYAEFQREGKPYTLNDQEITADEFIQALAEVVTWKATRV